MELNEFILANEKTIRMGFFFGILVVMAVWEILAPRRALTVSKTVRWLNNLGIVFLYTILLRLILPTAAVGVALFAEQHGWGLLNYYETPFWLAVTISVVAMDFIIYTTEMVTASQKGVS